MSDLAVIATDPTALEQYGDPAEFVVLACERAKTWLTQALDRGDIDAIVETKAQADAIRIYTAQKQLGKDAELAATEIVRRAERGIGVAIRRGQDEGTIRVKGEPAQRANQHGPIAVDHQVTKTSPSEFIQHSKERLDIYAMTDNVSDDDFQQAINEARAEGDLRRANVVRKVTANKSKSAVEKLREAEAAAGKRHELLKNTRHIDPTRIVSETVIALEGLAMGVDLIKGREGDLDPAQIEAWATSLSNSLRSLNRLSKQLKEMTHG